MGVLRKDVVDPDGHGRGRVDEVPELGREGPQDGFEGVQAARLGPEDLPGAEQGEQDQGEGGEVAESGASHVGDSG